jgi:hypothetical protein
MFRNWRGRYLFVRVGSAIIMMSLFVDGIVVVSTFSHQWLVPIMIVIV